MTRHQARNKEAVSDALGWQCVVIKVLQLSLDSTKSVDENEEKKLMTQKNIVLNIWSTGLAWRENMETIKSLMK